MRRFWLPAGMMRMARRSPFPATVTFLGTLSSTADLTTYNLGTIVVPRDGLVVVTALSRDLVSNSSVSAITVGGTSCVINTTTAGPSTVVAGIGSVTKTAGTHNVTITFSGLQARACANIYLLENLASTVPLDATSNGGTAASATAILNFGTNSVAVYCTAVADGVSEDQSWQNAIEDSQVTVDQFLYCSVAHKTASGPANNELVSWIGSKTYALAAAVWS